MMGKVDTGITFGGSTMVNQDYARRMELKKIGSGFPAIGNKDLAARR
jgi:hypothetical protein